MENYIIKNFSEFTVNHIGMEKCKPSHTFSWQFKNDYLIHYIISGKGIFECGGKTYSLKAGEAFFIGNKKGIYTADENDPWTYVWINFSGTMGREFLDILRLSADNPVYVTNNHKKLKRMFEDAVYIDTKKNEFYICSEIFSIFSEMIETSANAVQTKKPSSDRYIDICREYVKINYMKKISASDLSRVAMIEYSYLFRLFKEKLGISPGEYIINRKITIAAKLLCETDMTISEAAASVGYDDRAAFSKLFKKKFNISPNEYRQRKVTHV